MYLGHSFLAFAIVAAACHLRGVDRRRTLVLAGLAAGYGLLPDVDTWRTAYVFLQAGPENVFPTEQYVWSHSWVVHRALTHSVVTGGVVAAACGLLVRALGGDSAPRRLTAAGGVGLAVVGLVLPAWNSAGTSGVVTVGLFVLGAGGLAIAGYRRGATPSGVAGAAAVALFTHPFGDLWMGRPPAMFFPLSADAPLDEMFLAADPVLHFLAAVAVEIGLLWACLTVGFLTFERRVSESLSPLAFIGAGTVALLGRMPAPTFAEAYQFSTGLFVLSLAASLATVGFYWRARDRRTRAFVTGVAAFGLGLVSYAVVYVLFG